jgi:hypothetical protein
VREPSRWHTRAGVVHIHRSPDPGFRVLLLDSRRDGLPPRAEEAIAGNLHHAGLEVDLDAVSDPQVLTRVLDEHPQVLDGYDAVVAIAPLRSDWRGSSRALARVLERVGSRVATLLVERPPSSAEEHEHAGAAFAADVHADTLRLPSDAGAISTARQISAALRVLLQRAEAVPAVPAPDVARLRADVGAVTVGRLDRITELARDHFGVAVAEVNLVQGGSVLTVASAGEVPGSHPADDSLCVLALRNAGITVMADTWLDPEACRRTPTHEPDAIRYYAACPIRNAAGERIGVLCIWDLSPRDPADLDVRLLHDLALLSEGELIGA